MLAACVCAHLLKMCRTARRAFRKKQGHPYQQRPVTAEQSKTRRRTPQGDAKLMTKKQILSFKPASRLEQSATNIPSECKIASIGPDDAMILPHDANPGRIKSSERTIITKCGLTFRLGRTRPTHARSSGSETFVAHPILGGLHHRYSQISFSEATPANANLEGTEIKVDSAIV